MNNSTMIVVGTNPTRGEYLRHFFDGIPPKFLDYIYVAGGLGMEVGHIAEAFGSGIGRFAFVQDSMKVHDWPKFMDDINDVPTGYVIPRPSCYSMIYSGDVLAEVLIPHVGQNKELSITMEVFFCDAYENKAKEMGYEVPVIYPEMTDQEALDADRFYYGLGDKRLHLRSECGTLSKMKACFR